MTDASVLEKLIVKRLGGLGATELELACCDASGQSVQVSAMFKLAIELQKLIYRSGELVLGLRYRRSGQAKLAIRGRLCVVVQRPSSGRAFSLRIVLGDIDNIPFKENEQFRLKVVEGVFRILNGQKEVWSDMVKEDYVEGLAKLVARIRRLAGAFGEAIVLVAGEVVRLK
jgi:hypothetical protein